MEMGSDGPLPRLNPVQLRFADDPRAQRVGLIRLFGETAEAFAYLDEGHARGKVVITVEHEYA